MNLWHAVRKIFTPTPSSQPTSERERSPMPQMESDEPALPPELTPAQVQQALTGEQPPFLLDVREPYEWRQVRIPLALHIPMNDVPARAGELPQARPIVVFCAHGSRSYGVAHYLIEQGFDAANLAGGITQWRIQGGAVDVG